MQGCAFDLQRAYELAMNLLHLSYRDVQAHLHENIEQPGSSGIHEQVRDGELRSGKKRGGAEKKSGAGKISGDAGIESAQSLSATNADFTPRPGGLAIEFHTKSAQGDLCVVAGAQGLLDAGF